MHEDHVLDVEERPRKPGPMNSEQNEEQGKIEDSPIPQVRATVPITDDTNLPALTFRTWVLGPMTCILTSFMFQFYSYRNVLPGVSDSCIQIFLIVMGKLMAASLPTKPIRLPMTNSSFSLNPGPFNLKEHVVLFTLATSGFEASQAMQTVNIVKTFYHKNISFWASFLLLQTSQMIGYGFAGMFIRFLVENPYMWFPLLLPTIPLYRALHQKDKRAKGHIGKLQFFLAVSVCSFAYSIVPSFFFQSITALSFVCWIWKDSVTAQQLGSGNNGLGFGSFAIDWVSVSGWIGSPIVFPREAILNQLVGFLAMMCIITPIAYWTNSYDAKKYPIFSGGVYDINGSDYNVGEVLGNDLVLDRQKYLNYSKIHMSVFYVYALGLGFASISATISHFFLFHGRKTWIQLKQALKGQNSFHDIHNKLMEKYEPIPQWWFYAILIVTISLALLNCYVYKEEIQLPYWALLLACFLPFLLTLPFGVLIATTGVGVKFAIIPNLIIGYAYPGRPVASMAFISYSLATIQHTLKFIKDFKLAHYMKIPPKSMFVAQITGAFLATTTRFCTGWWLLSSVENICDIKKLPPGSPWTCPGFITSFSRSLIWGGVGPAEVFAPHGEYAMMYMFFLVGMISTVIVWILGRKFPEKKWIKHINLAIMFGVPGIMPPARPVYYWTFFAFAIFFNVVVYNKYRKWWNRYAYDLSNGMDFGAAILGLMLAYTLQNKDIYGTDWWGMPYTDHCPLATCPTAPGIKKEGCPVFS